MPISTRSTPLSKYPNTDGTSTSNSTTSSVWSSPNIGQMTEMSQDWYKKMINDSAELIKISCQPQYQQLDFSAFITQSQPSIASNQDDDTIFPFNSLPNYSEFDASNFLDGALLYTPDQSGNSSILPLKCSSPSPFHIQQIDLTKTNKESFHSGVGQSSRGRKYHNTNLLAQYCQEVLHITAHPTLVQISEIVIKLKSSMYDAPEKKLRSSIREWFRKRREYMATKIYRSCKRLLPPCPHKTKESEKMTSFLRKIHSNSALIGIIMLESKLPMQSEKEKIEFVTEKVTDFYLKYPQRKLRNCAGIKDFMTELNNLSQDDMETFINNNNNT